MPAGMWGRKITLDMTSYPWKDCTMNAKRIAQLNVHIDNMLAAACRLDDLREQDPTTWSESDRAQAAKDFKALEAGGCYGRRSL